MLCQTFTLCSIFPVQQTTTSGLGHRVKRFFVFATNTLNLRNNNNNNNNNNNYYYYSLLGWAEVYKVITYSKGKNKPGKVANPARGQLNRENDIFPVVVRSHLRIWSRETVSAVVPSPRVSLLISTLRLNIMLLTYYGIPPEFRGGVHLAA